MEKNNESSGDFILLGFSDWPRLEMVLFVVNMVFYFLAVTGNSTIIFLSLADLRLHTPMYFFLSNLSLLDLCYTTSSIPQLQVNLWGPRKTISFVGCVIQLFAFLSVGGIECILLSVMAYDRFVAVCKPLHYLTIMHPRLCLKLAAFAWLSGIANSILMSPLTMSLGRCGHRRINHFVCEMPAIIRISCVDTSRVEGLAFFLAIPIVLVPLTMILVSYGYIAAAVLRIKSAAGRRKAFNTCSSHMVVVSLFYSTIIYMYMQPGKVASQDQGKFLTLFYCLVTPTLNPFIYSLRNKDMKAAMLKVLGKDRSLLDARGTDGAWNSPQVFTHLRTVVNDNGNKLMMVKTWGLVFQRFQTSDMYYCLQGIALHVIGGMWLLAKDNKLTGRGTQLSFCTKRRQ
ncbi:LOW QUALITY PROTEIN: putative olfactory receptor 2W6 [Arvicola amphibius]|uniref:LOW QUALITY PROTEIN: putative olfactory receptor 2W6 n=1 Tax=Arvicola amphibius TaxID=1047088 RepID=UPI0018E3EA60|nr:LOW QUALITY PROTEIN: putative olfactory receptor 2W6 [Arvicola amphibius]